MAAQVIYQTGEVKEVKNLGWLLKNNRRVRSFRVLPSNDPRYDAHLVARMADDDTVWAYECAFASKSVLRDWLRRPVFRGLPLSWFGEQTEC